MGSCISKCYTSKSPHEENNNANNVQDKLVISQAPISPIPKPNKPQSPSQYPISSSSFSCATSVISGLTSPLSSSSSSSSLSCTFSTISSKERSFSNDFIRSCVKEHPHIIGVDQKPVPNKVYGQKIYSHAAKPVCASPKQSTPKKRTRANSPTLTRQKSFRKEVTPERAIDTYTNVPSRMARSPSPNRRFYSDKYDYKGALVQRPKIYRENISRNYGGKDNFRAVSPSNNFSRNGASLRDRETNKETHMHRIGTIVDEMEVQEEMSLSTHEDISSILVEDINNPLIALDCFIFL